MKCQRTKCKAENDVDGGEYDNIQLRKYQIKLKKKKEKQKKCWNLEKLQLWV